MDWERWNNCSFLWLSGDYIISEIPLEYREYTEDKYRLIHLLSASTWTRDNEETLKRLAQNHSKYMNNLYTNKYKEIT